MPPRTIDLSERAQLTERMDEPCSREDLRGCLKDLARLNRWFLAHRPLLQWLEMLGLSPNSPPVHILDVGCGYGDGLRRIQRWASLRNIAVALTGVDLNPDAVEIAEEASSTSGTIQWISADIFSLKAQEPIHIVISSQFTHHLTDPEIVRFLRWMEENARLGWFIGDLSRNVVPYRLIRLFLKVIRLHPFVEHDAPVSIARAFVPDDWKRLCAEAGLSDREITIQGFTPARLCVARRKQKYGDE